MRHHPRNHFFHVLTHPFPCFFQTTDNTEALAWSNQNEGFTTGIESIGNIDTIAPAVQKGNTELLNWINDEIKSLADEEFFLNDYKKTLEPVYGDAVNPEDIVVEGGEVN